VIELVGAVPGILDLSGGEADHRGEGEEGFRLVRAASVAEGDRPDLLEQVAMVDLRPTFVVRAGRVAEEGHGLGLEDVIVQGLDGGEPAPEILAVRQAATPFGDRRRRIGEEPVLRPRTGGSVPEVGARSPADEERVANPEDALMELMACHRLVCLSGGPRRPPAAAAKTRGIDDDI
jgi:hypothetical protein